MDAEGAKPQPAAVKMPLFMVTFQKREIRKGEVSFPAASHGCMKYLSVSSSPGGHAETPKKAAQQWEIFMGRVE